MEAGLKLIALLLSVLAAEAKPSPTFNVNKLVQNAGCGKYTDFCFKEFDLDVQNLVDKIIAMHNLTMTTPDLDHSMFIPRYGCGDVVDKICSSDIQMDDARYIKDKQDEWRIVIQSATKKTLFKQNVKMAFCKNPGKVTIDDNNILNFYCDQTYLNFKYLVLNQDQTGVEFIETKNGVPICCTCVYSEFERE